MLDGEIVIFGETASSSSTRSASASTPPSRGSTCSPSRRRRASSPSTSSRVDDETFLDLPYAERRALLEQTVDAPVDLTPCTHDVDDTEPWLHGAEGVIAKELAAPYRPGERTGMVKIKRVRTIDAVVSGWRPGKEEGTVGSLILGLYDDDGRLREVGHTSGFKAKEKRELVAILAPYETGERGTGEPSRWANDRDLEWRELRPELVVEVTFDHVSDGRIRHGTKLQRWREDKDPRECRIDQLES